VLQGRTLVRSRGEMGSVMRDQMRSGTSRERRKAFNAHWPSIRGGVWAKVSGNVGGEIPYDGRWRGGKAETLLRLAGCGGS